MLQDAVDAGQSIGIFEITMNSSAIVMMFPWALLVFASTLLMRPFRWSRIFWTYAVPVVPFVVLFDGLFPAFGHTGRRNCAKSSDNWR